MRFCFGDFELDTHGCTLLERGDARVLQPKVFDVLRVLVERHNQVVSKDELLSIVWPNELINDTAVAWSIFHARRALSQDSGAKRPIETVRGRGYRFAAQVRVDEQPSSARAALPTTQAASRPVRPLVGRAEAMGRLHGLMADALAGQGRFVLIAGEAGIGKTRCASELAERAAELGASAWLGRAVDDLAAPVFRPWLEVLRDLALERTELRGRAHELMTKLSPVDSGTGEPAQREPGTARTRASTLLMDVCDLLYEASAHKPVLIVIDDAQNADAGSLTLLRWLAAGVSRRKLLILATVRDDPNATRTSSLSTSMAGSEQVSLGRLSAQDVRQYLEQSAAGEPPADAVVDAVYAVSAGNPLHMQEAVRVLIGEHGGKAMSSLSAAQIEASLLEHHALSARLRQLPASARELLCVASVLGETFELSPLQALCELDTHALLEQLEVGARQGLVVAEAPHRYRFGHALIRDALYAQLRLPERVSLHRRAGELLRELPDTETRRNEVARHYYRSLPAGDYLRVVEVCCRAAEDATRLHAHDEAATLYGWALEAHGLDPEGAPKTRLDLLVKRGFAQRYAGRHAAARETLLRALELGINLKDTPALLSAARMLRPNYMISVEADPQVREALEAALRFADPSQARQEISARSQIACVPPYAYEFDKSKEQSGAAVALARKLGDPRSLAEALSSQLWAQSGPDDTAQLLGVADEVLALGDASMTVWLEAHTARVAVYLTRGQIPEADAALGALGETAHAMRLPEAIWYFDRLRAQRRLLDGEVAAAEELFAELHERGTRLGLGYCDAMIALARAHVAVVREGFASVAKQLGLAESFNIPGALGVTRAVAVRAAAQTGKLEGARRMLHALAVDDFGAIPRDVSYLAAMSQLAVAAAVLRDRDCCQRLYERLLPYASFNSLGWTLFYEGSVSHFLALLAAALGKREAEQHFEAALAMNRRIGLLGQVVLSAHEYAKWLSEHRPAERAQIDALKDEATQVADKIGMRWLR